MGQTVLSLTGVSKSFKGIQALDDIQFAVDSGEIHVLLGENGAGKSTILNIMSGSLQMDKGEIVFKNEKVEINSPHAAREIGISKVHQELQLVPDMTVYENIFLGYEIMKNGAISRHKMAKEANKLLASLDAEFDSSETVRKLSVAQQQLVEIAKAILMDFSVLILDEPTSSLTSREIEKLFEIMRRFKQQGKAIIFVSHRLEEVFEIGDRVTIFRDGKYIATRAIKETSRPQLIELMTGRDLSRTVKNETDYSDEVVLSVKNLNSLDGRFRNISFELHKGEILGFAGLVGAGRTETMRAIFGADKFESGEIELFGEKVNIKSPEDSLKRGLALVPEDRKGQGIIGILPNMFNVGLCSFERLSKGGMLVDSAIKKNAKKYMEMINVKPLAPELHTENMSGGNQQKVVLAKLLSVNARIIIMDEPTRGIDVGAKDEIYRLMLDLISQGVSIIMISSELPEVLSMSHRIMIMHEGDLVGELNHQEATETNVLQYAMGGN